MAVKDSCPMQEFKDILQFNSYEASFHGKGIAMCVVEPKLSARNSYAGVFAAKDGNFELQFIFYGAGIKFGANRTGAPMILECSSFDPDSPDYSINRYLWNGKGFVFSRNVPQRN
ncbi:hypothetical protein [Paraburkholderia kururiensis]|uniref:hypothetical protein n=1 Tax=Paraburkholderia kururiensis TaxID=984307 RepID=UPI0018F4B0AE|nr:hypothetical protein [Paraburkholderia kururiensis]